MGKHKMELTEDLRGEVIAAWNLSGGNISHVAASLGVGWQTARRWLVRAGCVEANERLDRPGLAWPCFRVETEGWIIWNVEAPNWALACDIVHGKVGKMPTVVSKTNMKTSEGFDRRSVKERYPGYMDRSLSVPDLAQLYIDLGVIVK